MTQRPDLPHLSLEPTETSPPRHIRSFIRRKGRMTAGQSRAMEELWPQFGLSPDIDLKPEQVFGRGGPLVLEIGFGNGESLAQMAAANPDTNFIGIDVHQPGVGHLLLHIEEQGLSNIRVYCADAIEILTQRVADTSLDRVQLFFPDPWPKKRHHKRRIVSPDFIALITDKLKPGGHFHAATDWEDYALQMADVLSQAAFLSNTLSGGGFAPRPDYRPLTKFETRGQRLGHGIWDLVYVRDSVQQQ
ncbi:MAG: tRNA (guanosine(46)-N7)-methyltransferase TrmB [Methylococcaceae bacterium]